MKVVIPYVDHRLRPEVQELVEQVGARFENLTGDDTAYFSLMARLWRARGTFIVVEQDMVPTVGLLEEMWACPQDWCSGYETLLITDPPIGEAKRWSMGCMKFGSDLMTSMPGVMDGPGLSWRSLDFYIFLRMGRGDPSKPNGVPHLHGPPMRHLHPAGELGAERRWLMRSPAALKARRVNSRSCSSTDGNASGNAPKPRPVARPFGPAASTGK